jgi:lysophospholipase L1-like esterase
MKTFKMLLGQGLALTVLVAPVFAASSSPHRYLALGDSVSFGYDPTVTVPNPQNYIGYPEILDPLVPKQEVNASCPGQTSASFLSGTDTSEVQGRNCEGAGGWKANLPLHVAYSGSQADFAVSQLKNSKSIDLVTLSIGGNDLLRVQQDCLSDPNFAGCVVTALGTQTAPGAALAAYGANLTEILRRLRKDAHYNGTLVLVTYVATSTDPVVIGAIAALNQVMTQVGSQFGAKMADGFTAFQIASLPYGHDPCEAGLLVRLSPTTCDVHPTRLGQTVLASTVLIAIFSR